MELLAVALLGGLAGLIGLSVGTRWHPKNKTARELQDYYERAIDTLKKDNRSLRAKVSYYMKGAIPSDLASSSDSNPEALLDGIIAAMPSNWRGIISGFKPQILAEMKKDPEATKHIIEVIKAKVGTSQAGDKQDVSSDAI
jgi:hypothetical protein